MESHIPRLSEVLFVGLCDVIGTPSQVKIRRDILDIEEKINEPIETHEGIRRMMSGSRREGFRLATSDVDTMIWFPTDIIICDLSQRPPVHPNQTVILMECHDTPPGFAKLQLLSHTLNPFIVQSSVSLNNRLYISSSLYRETLHGILQEYSQVRQATTLHGPCVSGHFMGHLEYDVAHCFSCQYWPSSTFRWIDRCQTHGWPSHKVLQDIIRDGCHLVAIGNGMSTAPWLPEIEWRISFSQAEYKLVSSMNHTQFLCYGLLKIFLKEVLNDSKDDSLLCSYFMKTSLFWKIQQNTTSFWCPHNILSCVWVCFKYLIRCVYTGEFPNFFIPQNNMFIKKIRGAAQKQLFLKLMKLYDTGFSCLLLSPTLYQILIKAILNPLLHVCTEENRFISEVDLDMELFQEIQSILKTKNLKSEKCIMCIRNIDDLYLKCSTISQFQKVALHLLRRFILVQMAFMDDAKDVNAVIQATENGCISDTLYVAMFLYNKKRYIEALFYIEKTKQKLGQPYILHMSNKTVNKQMYTETARGQTLLDKIKNAVATDIILSQTCVIEELKLELKVNSGYAIMFVPPLVMLHMLAFLCHHHMGHKFRSQISLQDLETLLFYNIHQYIDDFKKDVSWQILGICEEIFGDHRKAIYCYRESMKHPLHQVLAASYVRIQNINRKMQYLNQD